MACAMAQVGLQREEKEDPNDAARERTTEWLNRCASQLSVVKQLQPLCSEYIALLLLRDADAWPVFMSAEISRIHAASLTPTL